jgi:hypothetical protein
MTGAPGWHLIFIALVVPKTGECKIVLDVYYAWGLTRTIVTRFALVFDFDLNTCVVKSTTNELQLDVQRAMAKFARALVAIKPAGLPGTNDKSGGLVSDSLANSSPAHQRLGEANLRYFFQ